MMKHMKQSYDNIAYITNPMIHAEVTSVKIGRREFTYFCLEWKKFCLTVICTQTILAKYGRTMVECMLKQFVCEEGPE